MVRIHPGPLRLRNSFCPLRKLAAVFANLWNMRCLAISFSVTVSCLAHAALLFFSLTTTGELDRKSYHGGCPVEKGIKYSATKW